jgi:hypothetical protein
MFNTYKNIIFFIIVFILCSGNQLFTLSDFYIFMNSDGNLICQNDDSDDTYQEPEQNEENGDDSVQQPPEDSQEDQGNGESD